MYFELKENRPHGTPESPFSLYHIHNIHHAFQIPVHWHDELEIIYVKSGTLNVTISGENYIGNQGEAFVVSPGNLHFMGSKTGEVDYYTFLFPLEYVSFQSNDLLEKEVMSPLRHGKLMIKPQVGDCVRDICEELIAVQLPSSALLTVGGERKVIPEMSVQLNIKSILLQFFQKMLQYDFIVQNSTSGRNTTEKEMISYIQQNYTGEISLKQFGEQFHLSEKYISRYFKEHFHITLSQYINHLRMEHARQLLQETTLSVTEVAMRSGYENVSYFIRSFKKMYGMSPLKYRKL